LRSTSTVFHADFGVNFMWGEVKSIDGAGKCARVKPMFAQEEDEVPFDYCIIAGGCNFNPVSRTGESCWFPTVHQQIVDESEWRHLDERFQEGRRRRILEEHQSLVDLNEREGTVLIVGAGVYGVQWACELQQNFPRLSITISDFLPRCLMPMPEDAAKLCEAYLKEHGIRTVYKQKYTSRPDPTFWQKVGLPHGVDKTYIINGVANSNFFVPQNVKSVKGPCGGGWILTNKYLQVKTQEGDLFGDGCIFAVGDCIYGTFDETEYRRWIDEYGECRLVTYEELSSKRAEFNLRTDQQVNGTWAGLHVQDEAFQLPVLVKTGYTAEVQALQACKSISTLDRAGGPVPCCCCLALPGCCGRSKLIRTTWPWGSGIYAISFGSNDGCVVVGGNYLNQKEAGRIWFQGQTAATQKELIETTKVAQCRGDHRISSLIWYLIHHWPINCVGCCVRFPVPPPAAAHRGL
jgi:hypothetical protein